MKVAVVNFSQLGNCWSPLRFVPGNRCRRWNECQYPEKKGCKCREAEVKYHEQQIEAHAQDIERLGREIEELRNEE